MRNRSLIVILGLILSACASATPTKNFVRTGQNFDMLQPKIKNVAVIADVCLMHNATVGDNYWSLKDSKTAEQYMLESAKEALSSKGYNVVFTESPFVGGFKNQKLSMKYADEEGSQVSEMHPPFFVAEELTVDPQYKQSLITIMPNALNAVEHRNKPLSDNCCDNANMKGAINTISKKAGADAILILVGNGVIVSSGKSVAQGVATGVITTALTLGMFTYSKWDVSYLDTYAALIDSSTGEILWANSLRLKGSGLTEKDYYDKKWQESILYHIPARVQMEKK